MLGHWLLLGCCRVCRLTTDGGIAHSLKTLLLVPRGASPTLQVSSKTFPTRDINSSSLAIPTLCLSSLQHGTQGLQESCNCLPGRKGPHICHSTSLKYPGRRAMEDDPRYQCQPWVSTSTLAHLPINTWRKPCTHIHEHHTRKHENWEK